MEGRDEVSHRIKVSRATPTIRHGQKQADGWDSPLLSPSTQFKQFPIRYYVRHQVKPTATSPTIRHQISMEVTVRIRVEAKVNLPSRSRCLSRCLNKCNQCHRRRPKASSTLHEVTATSLCPWPSLRNPSKACSKVYPKAYSKACTRVCSKELNRACSNSRTYPIIRWTLVCRARNSPGAILEATLELNPIPVFLRFRTLDPVRCPDKPLAGNRATKPAPNEPSHCRSLHDRQLLEHTLTESSTMPSYSRCFRAANTRSSPVAPSIPVSTNLYLIRVDAPKRLYLGARV